jgi:ribonuclease D
MHTHRTIMPNTLVNTVASLERVCAEFLPALDTDNRIAIDTEFVGEQSYEPQLMLIQLAGPDGQIALIDAKVLAGQLDALAALLARPGLLKIMHAGGQDIPILRAYLGDLPGPLFDTQIAAAYVGFPLQTGLARLAEAVAHVRLAKGESMSDWTRRPIPANMLDYAADDVRHLHVIHARLAERLTELGRSTWVDDATAEMAESVSEILPAELLWRKIPGHTGLDRKSLAILRELCIWRDDEARRRDKPRRSVIKDEPLIELARRAPQSVQALLNLRSLPPNLGERRAAELVECVKAGLAVPPDERPRVDYSYVALDDQAGALLELLSAVARIRAIESDIAPSLLAPSDLLKRLAAGKDPADVDPLFGGWRGELIGDDLRAALAGTLSVAWEPGEGRLVCRFG